MHSFSEIAQAMFVLLQDEERHNFITYNLDATNHTVDVVATCVENMAESDQLEILERLSQEFSLSEYLGQWDKTEILEHVVESNTYELLDWVRENKMSALVSRLTLTEREALSRSLDVSKPRLRIHADGSATLSELNIPAKYVKQS